MKDLHMLLRLITYEKEWEENMRGTYVSLEAFMYKYVLIFVGENAPPISFTRFCSYFILRE